MTSPLTGVPAPLKARSLGESYVDGGEHLQVAYGFDNGYRWRNFGIVVGLMLLFLVGRMLAIELFPSEH